MSSMQELIDERNRRAAAAKAAKNNNNGNFDNNFEEVNYLPLQHGLKDEVFKQVPFRICGKFVELRSSDYDPVFILQSKFVKDDGKSHGYINWKWVLSAGQIKPDPDWIWTKIMNKITAKGRWIKDETKEKGGYKPFIYAGKPSLKRWLNNLTENPAKGSIAPKAYPAGRVEMNVISKEHLDSDSAFILTSKLYVSEKIDPETKKKIVKKYPDTGISASSNIAEYEGLYDKIVAHYINTGGDWNEIDTIILKGKKDWEVYDALDTRYLSPEIKNLVDNKPIDFSKYKLYNLTKRGEVTSYSKLLKFWGDFVKQVDIDTNSHFYDELVKLVNEEKAEREANKGSSKESHDEEAYAGEEEETVQEEKPALTSRGRRKAEEKVISTSTDAELKKHFPFWDSLTEDEKKEMTDNISAISPKGDIQYKDDAELDYCLNDKCTFVGTKTKTVLPVRVYTCPICDKKLN